MHTESTNKAVPGYIMLAILPEVFIGALSGAIFMSITGKLFFILIAISAALFSLGFYMISPKEGCVLQFFGRYLGTDRNFGLHWANPFYSKYKVSLKIRNIESGQLKVNEAAGKSIETAAVVV